MAVPDIDTLFAEAAWRAERIVAVLRLVVALTIAVVFAFAAAPQFPATDIVLVRQLALAGATIAGYVVLGLAALWIVASRNFRPWMAWLFSTIDVALLLVSLDAVMANTAMPGYYLAAAPVLWLAPAILAFGVLRYNPLLQIYMVALALAGLAAIVVLHMPALTIDAGASPEYLPRLFGASPNLIRFLMLALFGAVLIAAAIRARRLLARDILNGLAASNRRSEEAGEAAVAVGIGVHWGEMFVGGIGDEQRLEFSVLGDTVNIAARLQELSKHSGFALVVSKDLLDAAGEDPSANGWHALPPQTLRGKQRPTAMFGAT